MDTRHTLQRNCAGGLVWRHTNGLQQEAAAAAAAVYS